MLSRVKKGNVKSLRCTYLPLNVAKKSSLKFEKCWNEVTVLFWNKSKLINENILNKNWNRKIENTGSVFRGQTRLNPSSMMKRYEFMKLKFQEKHRNVYMHQLKHGKKYLSFNSAIGQAVVILKAVYGIKELA